MSPSRLAILLALSLAAFATAHSRGLSESAPATLIAQAPAPTKDTGTRPARPQEVRVRVILLSDTLRDNLDEYVEVGGARYIHFKSPRLKTPARPLAEPNLRYPLGDLDRKDGAVMLQLLVDENGALTRTDVVCAARGFEKSALESVTGLKFQPAVAKEGPVKSYMLVEFGYGRGFPCIPAPFY
jgi:outer membrane biosynthesis protein TonB